jgi:nucleoside-triphosphatase
MAHVDIRGRSRVGRYGVDVEAIDRVVKTELALEPGIDLYVVDEIGKMECLSARFVAAVEALLDSGCPLLATVAQRGAGFIADAKARSDVEIWEVTRSNRDHLPEKIQARLLES